MPKRVSNNVLLLISLIFFFTTITNLVLLYKAIPEVPTGKAASGQGDVFLCISHNITIISSSFEASEYEAFYDVLVITNPDSRQISYYENFTIFEIGHGSGIMSFTPQFGNAGVHPVLFWIYENNPYCGIHNITKVINFTINRVAKDSDLEIWDDTDAKGGGQTRYVYENVTFYANYTDASTGYSINGSDTACSFTHNRSGQRSTPVDMTFNRTLRLYTTKTHFTRPGFKEYNVTCVSPTHNFSTRLITDNLTITNRPPVLVFPLPNETMYMNTMLSGRDLDDYFMDPDGDFMTYNTTPVSNINIIISSNTHVISYVPDPDWFGSRLTMFYAYDTFLARADSNVVNVTVVYREPPPIPPPAGASGGAGGGGGAGVVSPCIPDWKCTDWERCLPAGFQRRKCTDFNECNTDWMKPNETQLCTYIPTCSDLIRNQGEEGVDCGGPCPPCPTCEDGIKNGGELGIDCGGICYPCGNCTNGIKDCHNGSCELGIDCSGPCSACHTCEDGIQNQNELGIDCGGPCMPCPTCRDSLKNGDERGVDCGGDQCRPCLFVEFPGGISRGLIPFILILILLIAMIGYVSYQLHRHVHKVITKTSVFAMRLRRRLGLVEKPIPALLKLRASSLLAVRRFERGLTRGSPVTVAKDLDDSFVMFAKRMIHAEGSLTHQELIKRIGTSKLSRVKRAALASYLKRIEKVKYSGYDISKPSLKALLTEAREIIDATTPSVSKKEEARAMTAAKPDTVKPLLAEMRAAIAAKDVSGAAGKYKQIKKEFSKLSPEDQKRIMPSISREYKRLTKIIQENK
ncbi:MAG: hypothetical protein KJ709_05825 [Nanoarchaeota archaeon]|nr:hypothetical protein [Nanoarchaeota archaeon]